MVKGKQYFIYGATFTKIFHVLNFRGLKISLWDCIKKSSNELKVQGLVNFGNMTNFA